MLECIHADLQAVNCPPGISLDDLSSPSYQSNEIGLEEHGTDFPHTARFTGSLIAVSDWWSSHSSNGEHGVKR